MPAGKLVRQHTHVSTRARRGKKYMRKTSAKGAYKPARKKQMAKRRAPFVETKSRTDDVLSAESYGSPGDPVFPDPLNYIIPLTWPEGNLTSANIPIASLNMMRQGLADDQMVGSSIFAKYLKMKLRFIWPTGIYNAIPGQDSINQAVGVDPLPAYPSPTIYLVHGFVKDSPNNTNTTGNEDPGAWTLANDNEWVHDHVKPYFDDREDRMRFIPKNHSIKILGYKRIAPNKKTWVPSPEITAQIDDDGEPELEKERITLGAFGDTFRTISWPMMRKIHYEQGQAAIFSAEDLASGNLQYINTRQWRPFAILYSPEAKTLSFTQMPEFNYNSILYYTDA